MGAISFIVTKLCITLIDVSDFAILIRVLLSWIPLDEDNKLEAFLYSITEPVIMPMRALMNKFDSLQTIPIDLPLLATAILLSIISSILSVYG